MSISEERKMILKMLEDGKISSDEAARLLEALEGRNENTQTANGNSKQANFQDEIKKLKTKMDDWRQNLKTNYNQKDFDKAVDDFTKKAEKIGKNVAFTTAGLVDKVADYVGSFVESSMFNIFSNYAAVEKSFEVDIQEGDNVIVEAINGNIVLKKHPGDKIMIKSKVRSPHDDAFEVLQYYKEENDIRVDFKTEHNISVSHEIYVPAKKLGNIFVKTTNGKIYAEDVIATEFNAQSKNTAVDLLGLNCDKLDIRTKNAKVQAVYTIGKEVSIETSNGTIDVKHIKAERLDAATTNGKISVENVQNAEGSPNLDIRLSTTNSDIKVNMNDMDNKGYKIKAQTTNSSVNILIPDLLYHNLNRQSYGVGFVEATTNSYDTSDQKVNIEAYTKNGLIEIVK